ncbi:MAG: hypothetical protein V2B17_08110 [Chloroflexota bacterium]
MILLSATVTLAHTPVAGAVREYSQDTALQYKWGGSYPTWFTGAMGSAFGIDWTNSTYNNSRKPTFSYAASGAGTVSYKSPFGVPACDGDWIGCSTAWGSTSWQVILRNFTQAPVRPYSWVQTTGSCTGTCFDARRVALHEIEHVTLAVSGHDSQGETNTIMASTTPSSPATGWATHHVQKCDEAAFQLKYDLAALAGRYADCFDHIAGHGSTGLVSTATISAPVASACYGTALSITGRLEIQTNTNYGTLGGNPLASRTVYIDRKLHSSGTWTADYSSAVATNANTGNNWSRSLTQSGSSGSITYDYRAHYKGEAGVDPVYSGVVSLTWKAPPCP